MSCIFFDEICLQQKVRCFLPWQNHELPIDWALVGTLNVCWTLKRARGNETFWLKSRSFFHKIIWSQEIFCSAFLASTLSFPQFHNKRNIYKIHEKAKNRIQGLSTQTALPYLETSKGKKNRRACFLAFIVEVSLIIQQNKTLFWKP